MRRNLVLNVAFCLGRYGQAWKEQRVPSSASKTKISGLKDDRHGIVEVTAQGEKQVRSAPVSKDEFENEQWDALNWQGCLQWDLIQELKGSRGSFCFLTGEGNTLLWEHWGEVKRCQDSGDDDRVTVWRLLKWKFILASAKSLTEHDYQCLC